jgi:hypothetical protein
VPEHHGDGSALPMLVQYGNLSFEIWSSGGMSMLAGSRRRRSMIGTSPMSDLEEAQNAAGHLAHSRVARFWLKELPYIAVLALTILGGAYTSMSQQPLVGYWVFLAVATGLVCVTTGWLHIHDPKARFRMVWTQALHWLAFLIAMNIVPSQPRRP